MILLVINICIFSIISPTAIVNAEEEEKQIKKEKEYNQQEYNSIIPNNSGVINET